MPVCRLQWRRATLGGLSSRDVVICWDIGFSLRPWAQIFPGCWSPACTRHRPSPFERAPTHIACSSLAAAVHYGVRVPLCATQQRPRPLAAPHTESAEGAERPALAPRRSLSPLPWVFRKHRGHTHGQFQRRTVHTSSSRCRRINRRWHPTASQKVGPVLLVWAAASLQDALFAHRGEYRRYACASSSRYGVPCVLMSY
jgi:hypothetical protein